MKDFDFLIFNVFQYLDDKYFLIVNLDIEFMFDFTKEFILETIKQGRLDILQKNIDRFSKIHNQINFNFFLQQSIRCNRLLIVKFLFNYMIENNIDSSYCSYDVAISRNDEMFAFMTDGGCPLHRSAMAYAIEISAGTGNLKRIKFIKNFPSYTFDILDILSIMEYGSIKILEYFCSEYDLTDEDMRITGYAASYGRTDMLKFLINIGYHLPIYAMDEAVGFGKNLETVIFLHELGFRCIMRRSINDAVERFNIYELQYMKKELGWEFSNEVISNAIRGGYIQINELQSLE